VAALRVVYSRGGGLPPDSPVLALGVTRRGQLVLRDILGQERRYGVRRLTALIIVSLFGGAEYLVAHWPHQWSDGRPSLSGFRVAAVRAALIESCRQAVA